MDDASLPQNDAAPAPAGVASWRLRFLKAPPSKGAALRHFAHPAPAWAVLEAEPFSALITEAAEPRPPAAGARVECALLHVLPGSAASYETQQQVEAWAVTSAGPDALVPAELLLQNERLIWRPGRVAFFGAAERLSEILPGLLHFVYLEGELARLEREITSLWPLADRDVPLVRQVGRHELARWAEVSALTEQVTRLRLCFARLEPALDKIPPWATGMSRRLLTDLLVQAAITDRVLAADDRIEALENLYELANDRLSEYSYFRKEAWMEAGIIVILLVEIVQALFKLD